MTKNYTPFEVVDVITKTIKEVLEKHVNDSTVSSAPAEEKAEAASLTKPTELIQEERYLTGQEPSHADAVDHHATLSVAHFHSGHDQLAKTHQELAIAHGNKIGVDALVFLKSVYGQFEDMEIPVAETFIPHTMDKELEKKESDKKMKHHVYDSLLEGFSSMNHASREDAQRHIDAALKENPKMKGKLSVVSMLDKKESAPAIECVKLVSGEGVDKQHIGTTPDDKKSKLLNDPSKDKVKKDEETEESTTDEKEIEKCGKVCTKKAEDDKLKDAPILSGDGFSEYWKKYPELKWHQAMQQFHAEKAKASKDVKKSESWENAERANLSMMAHQIGLFEPILKASVGPAMPKAPMAPMAPQMPKTPPMPAGPKMPSAPIAKEFDFASKAEDTEKNEWSPESKSHPGNTDKIHGLFDGKRKNVYVTGGHLYIGNHINSLLDHAQSKGYSLSNHMTTPGYQEGAHTHHLMFTKDSEGAAKAEDLDKAGAHPFKSKQIADIKQKRLMPTNKDEVSVDQELQGKGRPENNEDRGNAVLNKDKK